MPGGDVVILVKLKECRLPHGGEGNSATVYGHDGRLSRRVCIRIKATGKWVFDPAWEKPEMGRTQ
jgi:hypothetical protein